MGKLCTPLHNRHDNLASSSSPKLYAAFHPAPQWVPNHPIQQMGFQPPNPANGFPTNQSSKRLSNHPIHPSSTQLSTPLLKPPQTPDPKPPILPTPKSPPPLTLAGIRCPLVPPLPRPHHPIARAGSSLCVPHASTSRLCTRGHEAV